MNNETTETYRFIVVIEEGPDAWGVSVPDLPGCIAAGETRDEALAQIREIIRRRIDDLRSSGKSIPLPISTLEQVEVTVSGA